MNTPEHPDYSLTDDPSGLWLTVRGGDACLDRRIDVQELYRALGEYLAETKCARCDGTGMLDDLIDRQAPCPDCAPDSALLTAQPQAGSAGGEREAPSVCDGCEQEAFEKFANNAGMDMSLHPLHWLFLNEKTYAARQGWKAAIRYCRAALSHEAGGVVLPERKAGDYLYSHAWNNCLDEVARLNAQPQASAAQSAPAGEREAPDGKLLVSAEPLRRVLNALVNAPHQIRELQAAREPVALFADNPINILIAEYNAAHGGDE